MGHADKVTILNHGIHAAGTLALVAKMSDSERSALESEGRDGLAHAEEPDTAPPEIPYHTTTSIQHSPAFSFRKF